MRIYELDEDYYAARSLEDAVAEFRAMVGTEPESAEEVPDEALDRLVVACDDENEELIAENITLRQHLLRETGVPGSGRVFLLCCGNL